MQKSLVRDAESAYLRGNYKTAAELYEQLAVLLGKQYFEANIKLCERRMVERERPVVLKQLKIAAVMDDFTHHGFESECQLLPLSASRWEEQITGFGPDILFVESAWRGQDDSWVNKVSDPSDEFRQLLKWAKDNGVPTLLWCKEDPVHFSRFMPVARQVDHVFTTDMDCIAKYKRALGHERVYLLPFAAQPAMHNPLATVERREGFSFAGSWYPRYLERQADFRTLIGVARKLKWVDIYDRNGNRPLPHDFVFPEEFQSEIRGTLPYTEMDKGYKGYRYGITVNTVKQSQTMFARRALDLMVCNTVVVSNFSKGLRQLFGDLVIASDSPAELERRLAPLVDDDLAYRKLRLQALRKVLAEHTYTQRLAYIAGKVLARTVNSNAPRVAMLAEVSSQQEACVAIEAMKRQSWPQAARILIAPKSITGETGVEVLSDRKAAWSRVTEFDYVAPMSSVDYYGRHYVSDMALATAFATGDGVTKGAFHAMNSDGSIGNADLAQEYVPVERAAVRRSLLKPQLLQSWAEQASVSLEDAQVSSGAIVSVDAFSYCAFGAASNAVPAAVDAEDIQRIGVSLNEDMQPRAQRVRALKVDEKMALEAAAWFRLLPKSIDHHLKLSLGTERQVELKSTLPADAHKYVYLSRKLAVAEVTTTQEFGFVAEGDAQVDLRLVFVFLDADGQKISHFMHPLGARESVSLPAGTASIRLGLRIQGQGQASLGRVAFLEAPGPERDLLPSSRQLLVSRQYASYDDLYRYGFVHARVKAYNRSGSPAEVMRITPSGRGRFREFENVDVIETGIGQLERSLADGVYENLAVHIIDRQIWDTVREHLDRACVVIWAHGAEAQPWWRRAMNHATDEARNGARRDADARMSMWREILTLRHPNLSVVFISDKQAMEVLSDLRLSVAEVGSFAVVHNFVNGDLFKYVPKDPAQRFKLLSIRPFASPVYANDLTVRAIEDLAKEPFFDQLRIRIVGDGPFFEQTVEPLRQYPNIELSQGFLTQSEISALHRDYGVFLVPSRMDSQGVSRDEAMASGLVPITNRVAAIPDFVDETCGILAEPEDAAGIADGVRRLVNHPADFEAISRAAAARVRAQSNYDRTIGQELALFDPRKADEVCAIASQRLSARDAYPMEVALYGDVNLNIMDGSATWAASLAEVLGGIGGARVSLVLKARIQRTQVISRLLDLTPSVRLIEPEVAESRGLSQEAAVAWLEALDGERPFNAFILRGLEVCSRAAQSPRLAGRIWAYLTDIPQQAELLDDETRQKISQIVSASQYVLCQTPQMQRYFSSLFPQAMERIKLLPPMIPAMAARDVAVADSAAQFRYCYAGKFAPRWGIKELFDAHAQLRASVPDAELHVFGDKIHNPADDPGFHPLVQARLNSGEGLQWHGVVDRNGLMRQLQDMHASWAFRDPAFERDTLELSTKVLEYASLGVPVILAPSAVFKSVLGEDYPLFADTQEQALALLRELATNVSLRSSAAARLKSVASRYSFDSVRLSLREQGLFEDSVQITNDVAVGQKNDAR
ncbi:glycosyltransferase family protein [Caballeronia insecticola]|uniref:Methyltransferase FkbM family n=1 Tax=Caballeronia insecticola TaxID=758793 RepID=A0A060PJG1_9BURK|nr:glycosyltransferase [Caballeronia insecticola]BAO94073.1 methyltransferase FkbM family [Caballeronia insecticola]